VGGVGQRIDVFQHAKEIRLRHGERRHAGPVHTLQHGAAGVTIETRLDHLDALTGDDALHRGPVRRVQRARQQHAPAGRAVGAHRHQHRFGQRRGAVVQRCVGDIERRKAGDHALELVQHLQRALARLGLVGRVGGVELAAGDDLPHGGRNVVLIGTGAQKAGRVAITRRAFGEQRRHFPFRQAVRHAGVTFDAQLRRNLVEQLAHLGHADRAQHGGHLVRRVRDERHQADSVSAR
jgi:hypothetical protein